MFFFSVFTQVSTFSFSYLLHLLFIQGFSLGELIKIKFYHLESINYFLKKKSSLFWITSVWVELIIYCKCEEGYSSKEMSLVLGSARPHNLVSKNVNGPRMCILDSTVFKNLKYPCGVRRGTSFPVLIDAVPAFPHTGCSHERGERDGSPLTILDSTEFSIAFVTLSHSVSLSRFQLSQPQNKMWNDAVCLVVQMPF